MPNQCKHRHILLIGSEETGLQRARCCNCLKLMARVPSQDGKEWDYFPADNSVSL